MFYIISKEEFLSSPTFCYDSYGIDNNFYIKPFDDVEIKDHWEVITKEEFEANRPVSHAPKTEQQTKIDQLEMDNALILMELAEKDARIAQAEADHATLLMELAMKGVI